MLKKIGKFVIFIILMLQVSTFLYGNKLTLSLTLENEEIFFDETVTLNIVIQGNGITSIPDPDISALNNDFSILTSSYSSSSISIINGSIQGSKALSLVLKPLHTGVIKINGIFVNYHGKKIKGKPVVLTVLGSSNSNKAPGTATSVTVKNLTFPSGLTSIPVPKRVLNTGLEIVADVQPKSGYVGQQFIYRFLFITGKNLWGNPSYLPPGFNGFWHKELNSKPITQNILYANHKLQVQELRVAVVPLSSGKKRIDPAKLKISLNPFSGVKTIRTNPITLQVYNLPVSGKTQSFSGAVGNNFSINVSPNSISAKVNDPIQIKCVINGFGVLNFVDVPKLEINTNEFKIFKPQVTDKNSTTKRGVISKKIITYILQPLKNGHFVIPPIRFNYYSPKKRKYITIKSDNITVDVTGTSKTVSVSNKKTYKPILHTPKLKFSITDYPGKITGYLIAFFYLKWVPFVVIILFIILVFFIKRIRSEVESGKDEKEKRNLIVKLEKNMSKASENNNVKEFYGYWKEYFKLKYDINIDMLSTEDILLLKRDGLTEEGLKLIASLNSTIKKYLYAHDNIESHWQDSWKQFLKEIKRKK